MAGSGPEFVNRDALLRRWIELTRGVLPAMALTESWPIALDHCFMRVCLDAAVGTRWDTRVRRPAIRHLSDRQLAAAVAVAERIVREPAILEPLNEASLSYRRRISSGARTSGSQARATPR